MNYQLSTILWLLLFGVTPLVAQNKLSLHTRHYIRQYEQQTRTLRQDTLVTACLSFTDDTALDEAEALGAKINLRMDGIATMQVPLSKLADLVALPTVSYIDLGTLALPMLDEARRETGAGLMQTSPELPEAYRGKGVVVGVVDAGFDYTHPAFYDSERKTLRIKRVWEQTSTLTGQEPEGFSYGRELDTSEEILAAGGDYATNSHGTHVAAIAVGADTVRQSAWQGVSPEADIVLVSVGATTTHIADAVAYIFDYAEKAGKPCVVNLSLGTHGGPHDGTSAFDVMADRLQGPGRVLVGSAGNFGHSSFHVSHSFASVDEDPLQTFVSFKDTPSTKNVGGDVEIWGEKGMEFEVKLISYNLFYKNGTDSVTVYPSEVEGVQSYKLRNFTGEINVSAEVSPLNGKPHILISSGITAIRTNHALALKITPLKAGGVDVWADEVKTELTANDIEGFKDGTEQPTVCEIGGTGKRIISVGAYTTRNTYRTYGTTSDKTIEEIMGDIATFSSRGPTADGRMKPEITAPGCFIVSAVSSNDVSGTLVYAWKSDWNGKTYPYGYMQGTSMAAPFVTGCVAAWLGANPTLTPEQAKEIMESTARTDEYATSGNNTWGYGKIAPYDGLKACIALASGIETVAGESDRPVVFLHRKNCESGVYLCFGEPVSYAEITLFTLRGQKIHATSLLSVSAGEDVFLNVEKLLPEKGLYILRVATDKGVGTWKIN